MTIALGDIKTSLRAQLGRGTSQDASLFSYVRRALMEIERTRKFNHMYTLFEVQNDPNVDLPRALKIPNRRVRSIDFMRITKQDGELLASAQVLRQIFDTPRMPPPQDDTIPTAFQLIRSNLLILNNTPAYTYTFEGGWWEYSEPVNDDSWEHWLFDNFEDGVLDYSLAQAAKATRDFERANALLASGKNKLDSLVMAAEDQDLDAAEIVMRQDFYDDLPVPVYLRQ